ncbi:MAG: tetratricopeptide repeat protein, partial [Thermodesulfobacteriota bacterium]|nr:tetratricopeptide repeat protein [Thermodesulfobacteriota bacterium]
MFRLHTLIVSCGLFTLLTGCLLPQQQVQFQSDIQSLDKRLRTIEQRPIQHATQGSSERINNMGRQQANLKAELDSLRVDLQTLSGRFEDQQYAMQQLRDELTLGQNDLSLKVANLQAEPANPTSPVKPIPNVSQQNHIPPATTITTTPLPALTPTAPTVDAANSLYRQALQLVQQGGDFGQSRTLFKQFMQQYPSHKLAINAMYWIGETYYGDKKYENAILQFQDVIQQHADHPKVPAALTK